MLLELKLHSIEFGQWLAVIQSVIAYIQTTWLSQSQRQHQPMPKSPQRIILVRGQPYQPTIIIFARFANTRHGIRCLPAFWWLATRFTSGAALPIPRWLKAEYCGVDAELSRSTTRGPTVSN